MSLGYIGTNIPSEWEAPLLTDLVTPKQWKTISTKALLEQGYVVYGANGKIGFYNSYTHEYPTIMITCRGATCGSLHISEPFSYINGNAMALDGQRVDLIGLSFLYHALAARGLQDTISGSAQPQITGKGLSEVRLPLPPLAEQKAIAEKLDTLLAQVESTKARLERIPKILKRFRQSVLAAAVSGKLTEEWRTLNGYSSMSIVIDKYKELMDKRAEKLAAQPLRDDEKHLSVPETWHWTRLASIAEIVSGVAKGSKTSKELVEVPYLRVANVQRGYLDLHEIKTIAVPMEKAKALKLEKGDILFNEGGDLDKLGRGWIWNGEVDGCIHQNHVFRARCYSSEISPKFISYYGNSEGRDYFIRNGTQSVNLASINKTTLSLLPIPIPPFKEQQEIVRRVDQLFAYADTIETQVNNALERVNNLTQSILAKAFRGELTEQWRKDNPDLITGENSASALLEKIKAERAAAKPVKRGRKKA